MSGKNKSGEIFRELDTVRRDVLGDLQGNRQETTYIIQSTIKSLSELLVTTQKQASSSLDNRLHELSSQLAIRQNNLHNIVSDLLKSVEERLTSFSALSEGKLENIRHTMETRISALQNDNAAQLELMRNTVDEKLQKTLESRISQSFQAVNERLEQVYKGLGEMQNLAIGVGDLKKVLSNVKTRGILGEVQLGAILEEILSNEQYSTNVVTKQNSSNPVEFAVKLPGDENGIVYLPIDAKFPADCYSNLSDAYEKGDTAEIELNGKILEQRIKQFAKDIRDKYIDPPHTTDFAIMFLPFEGLYCEVVRRGMIEVLQREYKVNIAGPTTMAALLNSLQMGFKTLAIQKRSGEVWNILTAVKTEFERFDAVLSSTRQRLEQANSELDKLVGVRTRQIQRTLKGVSTISTSVAAEILELEE